MRPPSSVEVFGSAKVNVGWRVGGRRPDGFHDVSGLVQTTALRDRLQITTREEGPPMVLEVPGRPELEGEGNLVWRAAQLLSEHVEAPPTRIVLEKVIPVAAGLGGGSADAAAALVGLNTAWGAKLTARELTRLGAEVGSDVPAILIGGLVHASGRGEVVRNVGSFYDGWLVLGVGAEKVSAADAYRVFDEVGSVEPISFMHNDLEAAACRLVPGLGQRVEVMRAEAGVAFVSGSGPTVVGVVGAEERAHRAAEAVRPNFADVLVTQPSPWGVRLTLGGGTPDAVD